MAINTVNIADKPTLDGINSSLTTVGTNVSTLNTKINQLSTAVSDTQNAAQTLKTKTDSISDALDSVISTSGYNIIVKGLPENTTVIARKNNIALTEVSDENETCSFQVPEIGTWGISATSNGRTVNASVYVGQLDSHNTVFLELFSAKLNITTEPMATVTAISDSGVSYSANANSSGSATITINKRDIYHVVASVDGVESSSVNINITEDYGVYTASLTLFRKINITAKSGASITVINGSTTISFTSSGSVKTVYIPNDGTWEITGTSGGEILSESITVDSFTTYTVEFAFAYIYGIEWDGSSSPQCTRTDDSALFSDPEPYVADGNHPGSSPFDNIMPWSGMVKETIGTDVFVKIPKFWFKVTTDGKKRKIQIANKALTGFSVSPAHQDRDDGKGERDYVYVSRYHVSSGYKSVSGVKPLTGIYRSTARDGCSNRGVGYCQFDMMTLITIWYLYLVEFAHWNSQAKIGYGCGNNSATENLGASDSMPYHTGTMQSSRASYGVGCQYRWIEDLWGNVMDWVDGIYFSSDKIYAIKNPADFGDKWGRMVGYTPTSDSYSYTIKSWDDCSSPGYEWFVYPDSTYYPNTYTNYCCDMVQKISSGVAQAFGGPYYQGQEYGLFCLNGNFGSSQSSNFVGARLLYLP